MNYKWKYSSNYKGIYSLKYKFLRQMNCTNWIKSTDFIICDVYWCKSVRITSYLIAATVNQ